MFVKMMKKLTVSLEIINYSYFAQLRSILKYDLRSILKLNSMKIMSFQLSLKDYEVDMFYPSRQLLFSSLALFIFPALFDFICSRS